MTRHEAPSRVGPVQVGTAGCADALLVLVFAALGRGSHGDDVLAGLAGTAWPFLLGLLVGWLAALVASRGRFRPRAVVPTGVLAWAGTLAVGMLVRVPAGQGTAPTFVLVAGAVLALFLIGWRAVAAFVDRRRRA